MDEALAGLEFIKAMILFDPTTGETLDRSDLNKDNRISLDAIVFAIDRLKTYRWRQQSEEPAPLNCYVLVCDSRAGFNGYTLPQTTLYDQHTEIFNEYWMPLPLPDMR